MAGWFDKARLMWQYCRTARYDLIWDAIRVPVAFMVAPLGAPMIVGLLFLSGLLDDPEFLLRDPKVFTFYVGMTGSAAYVVTLVVGVPLFLILRRLKLTEFWLAPAVGGVLPWIAILIFVGPMQVSVILLAALCGATVGTILWVIARPDRDVVSSSGSSN